jgi:hypothetical protein
MPNKILVQSGVGKPFFLFINDKNFGLTSTQPFIGLHTTSICQSIGFQAITKTVDLYIGRMYHNIFKFVVKFLNVLEIM